MTNAPSGMNDQIKQNAEEIAFPDFLEIYSKKFLEKTTSDRNVFSDQKLLVFFRVV